MKFLPLLLAFFSWCTSGSFAASTIVTWTGAPAKGGSSNNNTYTSLGVPAINAAGKIAFGGTVREILSWPLMMPLQAQATPVTAVSKNPLPTPGPVPSPVIPKITNTWSGIWTIDSKGSSSLTARIGAPFGIMDAGGFGSLSDPLLNNLGTVAWSGTYYAGFIMPPPVLAGAPVTDFYSGSGVWTSSNTYPPIAFVGETAPGYPNPFTTSVGTLSDIFNRESPNGFQLSNPPITFTNRINFSSIDRLVLPETGRMIFSATVETSNYYYPPSPTSPGVPMPMHVASQPLVQHGIWANSGSGNLSLVAREGEILNVEGSDKTIQSISFLSCTNESGGQTRSFNPKTGAIVYTATFTDGNKALFLASSTSPSNPDLLISATGDQAPGFPSNTLFASFGDPILNSSNHVAFQATVSSFSSNRYGPQVTTPGSPVIDPLTTSSWSGIWADNAQGNLKLIVQSRRTGGLPFVGGNGFTSISDPVYNNLNNLAFTGTWYSDGTPVKNSFNGGQGVWTSRNLSKPVAWIGQTAPGYPKTLTTTVASPYSWWTNKITFISAPPVFSSFDRIALPDTDRLLIWGTVTATNFIPRPPVAKGIVVTQEIRSGVLTQRGIWVQNAQGGLDLIIREGASIFVNGKPREISTLSSAGSEGSTGSQSRAFNQTTGALVYLATFTDSTQAIVKVTFP